MPIDLGGPVHADGSSAIVVLIIVGILAGIAIFAYLRHLERKKFQEYAETRGWAYSASDRSLARAFPQVEPFGRGHSRSCTNVLRYDVGGRTGCSFDYAYTESSGSGDNRSSTTYRFHVVSLDLPHPLPRLTLRPEGALDGVAKLFGAQDVQFESADFNRAWLVKSDHLPAAHDVIHPRMMQWLMEPARRRARFVMEGTTFFTYTNGRARLENIDPLIERLAQFRAEIPEFVWHKAQGEYPRPGRSGGLFRS